MGSSAMPLAFENQTDPLDAVQASGAQLSIAGCLIDFDS
jgi:hypothetical protein